ncbi:MAG TPA: amidohydrolase family protein, partial [Gammaproteobacteria bacterium]|nr:amidohydrolase family protein [Gammaproteobacteria bacterium]
DLGGYHHNPRENAREVAALIKAGLPPMAAIQSATSVGADLLNMTDKIGRLSRGKYADIIAVPDNPLVDIHALENVSFVMKGGEIIKQASLDE